MPVDVVQRSRVPFIAGIVVGAVALLIGLVGMAVFADSRIRANEMDALLTATEVSEAVSVDYATDPRWGELITTLRAGQNSSGRSEKYYNDIWRAFVDDVVFTAQGYMRPMQEAILDVEAITPLPWHGDIAAARDAYLEHAEAWQEAVNRRASHDSSTKEIVDPREGLGPEIATTFTVAERRFRDVSILWAPSDFQERNRRGFRKLATVVRIGLPSDWSSGVRDLAFMALAPARLDVQFNEVARLDRNTIWRI